MTKHSSNNTTAIEQSYSNGVYKFMQNRPRTTKTARKQGTALTERGKIRPNKTKQRQRVWIRCLAMKSVILKMGCWWRTKHFREEMHPCRVVSTFQTTQDGSSAGTWFKATPLCCAGCRSGEGRRSPRPPQSKLLFSELNSPRAPWTLAEPSVYFMHDPLCPPISSGFPSFCALLARLALSLASQRVSAGPAGRHTTRCINLLWYTVDTLWIAVPGLLMHLRSVSVMQDKQCESFWTPYFFLLRQHMLLIR